MRPWYEYLVFFSLVGGLGAMVALFAWFGFHVIVFIFSGGTAV